MNQEESAPEITEKKTNRFVQCSALLLLLSGIGTVVVYLAVVGHFPRISNLILPIAEAVAGILLLSMRNQGVAWIVLVLTVIFVLYRGYEWNRSNEMAQVRASMSQDKPPATVQDRDPETVSLLSSISRIETAYHMTNLVAFFLDLGALLLVFGTRRGRDFLLGG